MGKEATRVRRRERKNIASGIAHVNASFNNTMITVTDAQGNPAAVAPVAPRGSGNASVHVLYATPGSQLAVQKQAAESANTPLVLGPDHPLSQQAYTNQQ